MLFTPDSGTNLSLDYKVFGKLGQLFFIYFLADFLKKGKETLNVFMVIHHKVIGFLNSI